MTKLLQDRFPGIHSEVYTQALRAIPGDVLLTLPDHQVDALVRGIVDAMNKVADTVNRERTETPMARVERALQDLRLARNNMTKGDFMCAVTHATLSPDVAAPLMLAVSCVSAHPRIPT